MTALNHAAIDAARAPFARLITAWLLIATLNAPPLAHAQDALEARVKAVSNELRCLVCQNQTIADSHAPLAIDLRQQIREQLLAGRNEDDIRRFMTARYGDFILYRPPVDARTSLLWFGPAVLAAGGLLALWATLRQRARLSDDAFDADDDLDDERSAAKSQ